MCGISLFVSDICKLQELEQSLSFTIHRGPDADGIYTYNHGNKYVGLGHNRLSVLDLSELGRQPMMREEVVISFNGEIYNFLELRSELQNIGYTFESGTDTEVIIYLYIHYGADSFSRLKGMFSFVLLDQKTNQLYIVRDVIGVKPIYIYQSSDSVYACSEIKGLRAFSEVDFELSKDDIFEFFNNGFLYEPSTGFENIKKILPGHYLSINLNSGARKMVCFNTINSFADSRGLKTKVHKALTLQEVADVPLGVFFSGGADSTILASLSKDTDLLFAKYDREPSSDIDLKYSALISEYLGKNLKTVDLQNTNFEIKDILDSFDFVARYSEELISDYTFWSTYLLSCAAREQGYKVMLSGMGGDEAFAGYPRYMVLKNHVIIKLMSPLLTVMNKFKIFPRSLSKKFERLVSYSKEKNWAIGYSRLLGYFSTAELLNLFPDYDALNLNYSSKLERIQQSFSGNVKDKVKLGQYFDLTGFLTHNLTVSDKASMLASIELRVPLLDEHVVAHGLALSSKELIVGRSLKHPLRLLLKSLIPQHFIDRPKTGFNPPLDGLIHKLGESTVMSELESLSKFLSMVEVSNVVSSHFAGNVNNTYKIWQLLYFARWVKVHNV
ncbi:asparagine synthase (glutamine-hydrolyzing) [Vibrio metoecus]|uniref:asparagine synthase (glutamine-hydrolyzing) n=1 Tax=Vibrio metoecus TaxID=1481663 RepID=UPI0006D7DFCE|nr:asparagine synthase (glutamine-hydrolyzing) [Vibrio metoecus]KQA17009.1 asparagine synthase [Vibrio metoecus]